jgi:pyruvate/2-oxoglutarate dehydrogenase complex dihydrolipoamide acyltransferase (E2) component
MAKGRKLKGWRKIAASTWGEPNDPQIYGDLEVDATSSLAYIDECKRAGNRVTLTHLVGKSLAHAFAENPDLNGRLYRGRFIQRDTIDIFFIVSAERGQELSGVKVERADGKSVVSIADELRSRAERIHSGDDQEMGKAKEMMGRFSPRLLGRILRIGAWLAIDRDMDLKKQGLPRQAFGSAMVSSVGMLGLPQGFAPIAWMYGVPLLVLVGELTERALVVDHQVVARPVLPISATIDHRYVDGWHVSRALSAFRAYLEDPERFEPGGSGA